MSRSVGRCPRAELSRALILSDTADRQMPEQRAQRRAAMADRQLPLRRGFAERAAERRVIEQRIVPESMRPARLLQDAAFHRAAETSRTTRPPSASAITQTNRADAVARRRASSPAAVGCWRRRWHPVRRTAPSRPRARRLARPLPGRNRRRTAGRARAGRNIPPSGWRWPRRWRRSPRTAAIPARPGTVSTWMPPSSAASRNSRSFPGLPVAQ